MTMSDRDAAADLARRINNWLDLSEVDDEADRPAGDKSPGYAKVLMPEVPAPIKRGADLSSDDWNLIGKALESYATLHPVP